MSCHDDVTAERACAVITRRRTSRRLLFAMMQSRIVSDRLVARKSVIICHALLTEYTKIIDSTVIRMFSEEFHTHVALIS